MGQKWLRKLLRRRFLIVLLLIIQFAIMVYTLVSTGLASAVISRLFTGISVLVCVYIVSRKDKGAYKLTWVLGSDGESIQKMWSVITNILSYAWFSGFGSIPGMDKGSFSIIGIITVILLPEVAYILGYFAASKGFDYRDKLLAFMYEKKKNK